MFQKSHLILKEKNKISMTLFFLKWDLDSNFKSHFSLVKAIIKVGLKMKLSKLL